MFLHVDGTREIVTANRCTLTDVHEASVIAALWCNAIKIARGAIFCLTSLDVRSFSRINGLIVNRPFLITRSRFSKESFIRYYGDTRYPRQIFTPTHQQPIDTRHSTAASWRFNNKIPRNALAFLRRPSRVCARTYANSDRAKAAWNQQSSILTLTSCFIIDEKSHSYPFCRENNLISYTRYRCRPFAIIYLRVSSKTEGRITRYSKIRFRDRR